MDTRQQVTTDNMQHVTMGYQMTDYYYQHDRFHQIAHKSSNADKNQPAIYLWQAQNSNVDEVFWPIMCA